MAIIHTIIAIIEVENLRFVLQFNRIVLILHAELKLFLLIIVF